MDTILNILKELRVNEYRIIEKKVYSKEWFFIQKKLDMSRAKEITDYYLTVYQPIYEAQERFKGQASVKLSPSQSEEELEEIITQLIKEASLTRNPYFELPSFMHSVEEMISPLGDVQEVLKMMNDFHETEEISLNSYELFETLEEVRIVNSKGLDVTYQRPIHDLEVVINARNENHEVEIYQDLLFGNANIVDLKHRLAQACYQAEDRKNAIDTKEISSLPNIIIAKENVVSLCNYYLNQLNTSYIYNQYSEVKVGDPIGPKGFNLEGLAYLENSSVNHGYDSDGRAIRSVSLIEDGVVKNLWGNHETSCYLGMDDTTMVHNYKVSCGEITLDEMKKEPYLELVQFSSFSCHPITGDFAGEIRLGYYFDGEKIIPVTGGSISGNIKENETSMQLSKELDKYNFAVVPQAILLKKVNVSI